MYNKKGNYIIVFPLGNDQTYTTPLDVDSIGSKCFCSSRLKRIVVTDNVRYIGSEAFQYAQKLEYIRLSDNIDTLNEGLLNNAKLNGELILPKNLKTICVGALPSFGDFFTTIPSTVETIEENGLHSTAKRLIHIDSQNPYYCMDNDIIYSKDMKRLITANTNIEGWITIPEGIESIDEYAFRNCDKLMRIVIPESIKKIGAAIFYDCKNLSRVTIKSKTPPITLDLITDKYNADLYIPYGSREAYIKYSVDDKGKWYPYKNGIRNIYELEEETNISYLSDDIHIKVSSIDCCIIVDNKNNCESIAIYETSGELIQSINISKGTTTISLKKRGSYIVKTDKKTYKINI